MNTRLSNSEIVIVRSLARRCAAPARLGVSLTQWQRELIVPLWRRELIQVAQRLAPGHGAQGPYFSLSEAGLALAAHFFPRHAETPAPRGFSGADTGNG